MRVMVTGAAGVVGTQLCRYLSTSGYEVVPVDIVDAPGMVCADLRDEVAAQKLFEKHRPDGLLHLAANKNVFFCEENPEVAHAVNFEMTQTLVRLSAASGVRFVFFSSDYVFGSNDRVWREADEPCPTTQYGRDKAASERMIREALADCAIVRTAGLYGFPGDLIQVVRSVLSQGEAFNAFDNLINCPTWTSDLFQMLDVILTGRLSGIFHCVGPEVFSRFEYARCVAESDGLDVSLLRAESLDFSTDIRPPALRLDGGCTYERLGFRPGNLKDNLRKMNDG